MEETALLPLAQVSTVDSAERPTKRKAKTERPTPRFAPRMIRLSDIDRDLDQARVTPRSEENQASLVDTAVRTGFTGSFLELRGVVMAHHQDFDVRNFLADPACGIEPAAIGHADIQKNQVGI